MMPMISASIFGCGWVKTCRARDLGAPSREIARQEFRGELEHHRLPRFKDAPLFGALFVQRLRKALVSRGTHRFFGKAGI
jgi:hypothetical protein